MFVRVRVKVWFHAFNMEKNPHQKYLLGLGLRCVPTQKIHTNARPKTITIGIVIDRTTLKNSLILILSLDPDPDPCTSTHALKLSRLVE